jgi:hypothetical protein
MKVSLLALLPFAAIAYSPSGNYVNQTCDAPFSFHVDGTCHIGVPCAVTWKNTLPGSNVVSLNLYEQSDGWDPIAPVGANALPSGSGNDYDPLRMVAHLENASWGNNTFLEASAFTEASYYHGAARYTTVPQKKAGSVNIMFEQTATGWDHMGIVYDCWSGTSASRVQAIFPIHVLP